MKAKLTAVAKLGKKLRSLVRVPAPLLPHWWNACLHWHQIQRWRLWRFSPMHSELVWRHERILYLEGKLGVRGVRH
jgi:hypothetical protein